MATSLSPEELAQLQGSLLPQATQAQPANPVVAPAPAPGRFTPTETDFGVTESTFRDPALQARPSAQMSPVETSQQPMQLQMPAYRPPTYVPGGWQPATRSGRLPLSGDEQGILASADENREQANEAQTAVQMQTADDVYAALKGQQEGLYAFERDRLRHEADRQSAGRAAIGKLESLSKEANDAADINPSHFWDSKPAFARVLGAIGVALGGFVAARTGGPNTPLQMIEGAIDRDIDAQKARLAAARGKLAEQRGIIGALREQFGDERAADAAARYVYLDNAERNVNKIIANNASKDIQARGQQLLADIQERKFGHAVQLRQFAEGNVTERYRPGGFVGGGGAATGAMPNPALFVPTGPNGQGVTARTEKEAIAGRTLQQSRQNLLPLLDKLKAARERTNWVERGGKFIWETEDIAEIKSLQGQVALELKNLADAGAWDEGMARLGREIMGDWTKAQGHPEKSADAMIAAINNKVAAWERGQGAQGAQQVVAVDPYGRAAAVIEGTATTAAPKGEMPAGFRRAGGATPPPTYESLSPQQRRGSVVLPPEALDKLRGSVAKKSRRKGDVTSDVRAKENIGDGAALTRTRLMDLPVEELQSALAAKQSLQQRMDADRTAETRAFVERGISPEQLAAEQQAEGERRRDQFLREQAMRQQVGSEVPAGFTGNPTMAQRPAAEQAFRAAPPYEFDYRDPGKNGEGRRVGVMAQDLEKTPAGAQVVKTDKNGDKVIDGPGGLSLALAGVSAQEQRLSALEQLVAGQIPPMGPRKPAPVQFTPEQVAQLRGTTAFRGDR